MIYPKFLNRDSKIGIAAPSDGIKKEIDYIRLDNGIWQFKKRGFEVIETRRVRYSIQGRSGSVSERIQDLEDLYRDGNVDLIIAAKGGNFLMELLPDLDLEMIRKNPKWFQGFSDNTNLNFTITTNLNIATVYGCNFKDFGMETWHEALVNNIDILSGKDVVQTSFSYYEDKYYDYTTPLDGYVEGKPVNWRNIRMELGDSMTGRMLGGCLDILISLVGTRYDKTAQFVSQYEPEGIVWYIESYALNSGNLTIGLWQLKEAGWFKNAKGFVFGRSAFFEEEMGITYDDAVLSVLGELQVPIFMDADIGHKAPQFTVINGSLGTVICKDGRGSLKQELI
ncbi:MAG: S66 peptidase family protein [Anaerocolumna sp.]